jgi:hypothetical protein
MSAGATTSLIEAHFFFVDIVGLSNPLMSAMIQVKKLEFLNRSIADCAAFKLTPKDTKLVLPTGDGMAIGFLQGPELPLQLAVELHEKIRKYNRGRLHAESVEVRIGIHKGPVFKVNDVDSNSNIWGPGIIIARRVMDLGDDNHILVSSRVAEDLMQLSDDYKRYLHGLGYHTFKHNVRTKIYSAYSTSGKIFGNLKWPSKMRPREREILYPYIEVNMSIRDPHSMLVHYKRVYEIQNLSDEPLSTVWHQIATDVEKGFDELNIKVYDDEGKDLAITSVSIDKPHQKEFFTSFFRPLAKGGKKRYTLEYDLEEPERYFENMFFTDCEKFAVAIEYPAKKGISPPKAYDVKMETERKKKHKVQPVIVRKNKDRNVARWSEKNIVKGQSFGFKW